MAKLGPNNTDVNKTRALRHTLYWAAKRSPNRRFHALFDRVYRRDVLRYAWWEVGKNQGAAGVDAVTLADIEAAGVEEFLDELRASLRDVSSRTGPASLDPQTGQTGEASVGYSQRAGSGGPAGPEDRA